MIKKIPNILSSIRILAAPAIVLVYCLGGKYARCYVAIIYIAAFLTDVLDGFAARRLHTESEQGAVLDSVADLLFVVIYAVRILPLLSVPLWIWIWTAIIAVIKVTGIMIASKKAHRLLIEHSFGNKLTGLLLFLLPLSRFVADVKYGAAFVCVAATITVIKEINNT